MPKLTAKQKKAVAALVQGARDKEAAIAAGVADRTMARWKELPEFTAAVKTGSSAVIDDATRYLTAGLSTMLTILLNVAKDKSAPDSVRIRAALGWIDRQVRFVEQTEILERLDMLEEAAGI